MKKCKHGNEYACGLCMAEAAAKCRHGNAFYCGLCLGETGDGRVSLDTFDRVTEEDRRSGRAERDAEREERRHG